MSLAREVLLSDRRTQRVIKYVQAKILGRLPKQAETTEILELKFACATNGTGIIECDYFTNVESEVDRLPTDELWFRYQQGQRLTTATANALLAPFFHQPAFRGFSCFTAACVSAVSGVDAADPRCGGWDREFLRADGSSNRKWYCREMGRCVSKFDCGLQRK